MTTPEPGCAAFEALLDDRLDGELDAARARAFDAHVAECRTCAAELELARRVSRGFRELARVECPELVTERVSHALSAGPPGPDRGSRSLAAPGQGRRRLLQVAASLAVVTASAIALLRLERAPVPSPPPAYTREETALALRQLEWAFAFIGRTSESSLAYVGRNVIEGRALSPVRDAVRWLSALEGREGSGEARGGGR